MDIKSRLALSIIRTLGLLSLSMARKFGHGLGVLLYTTKSSMFRVTIKNLELCFPEMPEPERLALAKKSVIETSKTIAETGIAWGGTEAKFLRNEKQIKNIHNLHLFEKAVKDGNGLLMLTMHYGNWEWVTSYLPKHCDLLALYKMAKMPGFEQAMLEARESSGTKLVAAGREGVKTFIKHYQDKKACIILPDQEPSEKSGIWSSFFGVPALTPKFIHYLIQKNSEGTVLYVYMQRVEGGFDLVFKEVEAGIYSSDLETSVLAMNKGLEKCIADDLSQYQWEYKRFKRNKQKFYQSL
ncbi:MAG: KDO2-lipid IV(A) lauroyltransferase [Bermanella sp.]|jgi:KDO2-lipid IV(A) lauroyltransferase